MEVKEVNGKILKPRKGYYLTQVADVPIKKRIISTTICLGANDSISNYKEITEAEADKFIEERTEAYQEEERLRLAELGLPNGEQDNVNNETNENIEDTEIINEISSENNN